MGAPRSVPRRCWSRRNGLFFPVRGSAIPRAVPSTFDLARRRRRATRPCPEVALPEAARTCLCPGLRQTAMLLRFPSRRAQVRHASSSFSRPLRAVKPGDGRADRMAETRCGRYNKRRYSPSPLLRTAQEVRGRVVGVGGGRPTPGSSGSTPGEGHPTGRPGRARSCTRLAATGRTGRRNPLRPSTCAAGPLAVHPLMSTGRPLSTDPAG